MTSRSRWLRFGIMCRSAGLSSWQRRCIDDVMRDAVARPVVVVRERPSWPPLDQDVDGGRPRRWPVLMLSRAFASPHGARPAPRARSSLLDDLPRIELDLRWSADRLTVPHQQLEALDAFELDFILRFSDGPVPPQIATATPLGVWMYSHGDGRALDGWPPSFGDVLEGRATTTARLIRFTADGGHAETIHSGVFSVASHSYAATLRGVQEGHADWVARACRIAARDGKLVTTEQTAVRVARTPSRTTIARLWLRQLGRFGRRLIRGLHCHEQWQIGVVDAPLRAFLEPEGVPQPRWLGELTDTHYLADPFGHQQDGGKMVILAEEFDYVTRRGRLVAIHADCDSSPVLERRETVLPLLGHASYPYLLEHDGSLYCVPENHPCGAVRLYRAETFPTSWRLVADLVSGVPAVDPTLFHHGERWWLFFTDQSRAVNANLYIYHSTSLTGPWRPHRQNPVKTDVASSRSAGTPFTADGRLYRPAQDCAARYGDAVVLNEVVKLSPEEFDERVTARVAPDRNGPFPSGLHTLSSVGDRTLIDARCDRMLLRVPVGRAIHALRRIGPVRAA